MTETNSTGRPTQMMSFGDSITNCLTNNYVGFSGRASRSEYWFWVLFTMIVSLVTGIMDGFIFGSEFGTGTIQSISSIAFLSPGLAVLVRRLHDVGRSGWWFLSTILILPFFLILYWLISEGDSNPNEYGEVPTNTLVKEDGTNYDNY